MLSQIPLDDIAADALTRDRRTTNITADEELRHAILTHGLRMPIEVFPIEGPTPWGLISGHRRLAAVRALSAIDPDRFATIPAFIRQPETVADATRAMVEENEIRADLSPYERGSIAVQTRNAGMFDTLDAAIAALYPSASPTKRTRLRAFASVAEHLGPLLKFPESLSGNQSVRLANALRADFGPVIEAALHATPRADPSAEWSAILPYLEESEATLTTTQSRTPGRPRRITRIRPDLTIRREMSNTGYILRFSGRAATSGLLDEVVDEVERLFGR